MEGLLHMFAKKLKKDSNIYILNYYTAGLILFGERSAVSRQSLRTVRWNVVFPNVLLF